MPPRPLRLPARLAVAALLGVAQTACSDSAVPDGGLDAARDVATSTFCDAMVPDGQVCESVCYQEGATGLIATSCRVYCEIPPQPGATGACFTPAGDPVVDCVLQSESDSPDRVLC